MHDWPFGSRNAWIDAFLSELVDQISASISQLPTEVRGGVLAVKVRLEAPKEEILKCSFIPIEYCSICTLESHGCTKEEATYISQFVGECRFPHEVWVWVCEATTSSRRSSFTKLSLQRPISKQRQVNVAQDHASAN